MPIMQVRGVDAFDYLGYFAPNLPNEDVNMWSAAGEPIELQRRFAQIKQAIVSGREDALVASWHHLLGEIQKEVGIIQRRGPSIIPTIDFQDIIDPKCVEVFSKGLERRGVAVIRGVVSREEALAWQQETHAYLAANPHSKGYPTKDPQLYDIFWSPAQIRARAHPNVLATQKFMMSFWRSSRPDALVSGQHPVSYADRVRIGRPGDGPSCPRAHVDGGSVERWEPDGYGREGPYDAIWRGRWPEYDAWESSSRLGVTSDLYNRSGQCSAFRMYQGWLSTGAAAAPGDGGMLRVCPMLQLTTAYLLLRPFFSPRSPTPLPGTGGEYDDAEDDDFLAPANWALATPPTSALHGALPSYAQELTRALHPHLRLGRSLVGVPPLGPGDYALWHCDAVHAVGGGRRRGDAIAAPVVLYLPACPLTMTNALYLARQRRAFLLGRAGPDFGGGGGGGGESHYAGRPGVGDVNDAGGEEALRSMGLLPWDEDAACTVAERELLRMANSILFPDRHKME